MSNQKEQQKRRKKNYVWTNQVDDVASKFYLIIFSWTNELKES